GLVPVLALARFDIPWVGHAVRDLQRPTVHLALIVGAPLVWALLCIWSIWRPVVRVGLSRAQARRGARPSRQAHH
ncbi:MAG: hypothetical protein ACRDWW_09755, partial [Acidimicrobiales bacterium]